jgi:O-antigen ligase
VARPLRGREALDLSAIAVPLRLPARPPAPVTAGRIGNITAALVVLVLAVGVRNFFYAVTALTCIGLLWLVAGFWNPRMGLIGVGLLCTTDALTRNFLLTGDLLRWNSFNYLLLLVSAISLKRLLRWKDLPIRLLEFLLVLLVIGLAYSEDRMEGAQHILNATAFFGIMALVERVGRSDQAWVSMGVVCSIAGAFGGLIFFLHDSVQRQINPNSFAYFPLTALLTGLFALGRPNVGRMTRVLLLLLAAVNAGWIFLSGSRGTSIVALFGLLYGLSRARRALTAIVLAGAMLVAGLAVVDLFGEQAERSTQRINKLLDTRYSLAGRTSGRWDIARAGWYIFLDHPVSGVGTGAFAVNWKRLTGVSGLSMYGWGREVQAHSGWIKVLAENGAPGFLLFAAFVLSFAWCGFRGGGNVWPLGLLTTITWTVALLTTEFQPKGLWFLAAGTVLFLRRSPVRERRPALVAPARKEPRLRLEIVEPSHG